MTTGVITTLWQILPASVLLPIPTTNAKPVVILSSNILWKTNGFVVPQIIDNLSIGNRLLNKTPINFVFKARKKDPTENLVQ